MIFDTKLTLRAAAEIVGLLLADGGLTSLATQRLARGDEDLADLLALTIPPKIVVLLLLVALAELTVHFLPVDPRLRYFVFFHAGERLRGVSCAMQLLTAPTVTGMRGTFYLTRSVQAFQKASGGQTRLLTN